MCSCCKEVFPTTNQHWSKDATRKDGWGPYCKQCRSQKWRERYHTIAERHRARAATYLSTNRESVLARQREKRTTDPQRFAEYERRKRQRNPEKIRDRKRNYKARRRALLHEVENTLTLTEIQEIKDRQNGRCYWCGRKTDDVNMRLDHVIPLAKKGTNTANNVVYACEWCNLHKGSLMPSEFERRLRNGFYKNYPDAPAI
jgi:5-methylcytosine-specific restriction endonuclease McrA